MKLALQTVQQFTEELLRILLLVAFETGHAQPYVSQKAMRTDYGALARPQNTEQGVQRFIERRGRMIGISERLSGFE